MALLRRRKRQKPESMATGAKPLKPFYSKIAGVTRKNPDGTSRQRLLKRCKVGQPLKLVREPSNPADENAVMVLTMDGKQLGYLNADVACEIAPRLDAGGRVDCEISDLTGGGLFRKRTRGCNIKITKYDVR